jgi:hypothetical protein
LFLLFSEPFHKAETQTFPKLDRLKKEGSQTEDSGMGDAIAKTENIRNWVSINSIGDKLDTPKFYNKV